MYQVAIRFDGKIDEDRVDLTRNWPDALSCWEWCQDVQNAFEGTGLHLVYIGISWVALTPEGKIA